MELCFCRTYRSQGQVFLVSLLIDFYDQHLYRLTNFLSIRLSHDLLISVEDFFHCGCQFISRKICIFHYHWFLIIVISKYNTKAKENSNKMIFNLSLCFAKYVGSWSGYAGRPRTPLMIWCFDWFWTLRIDKGAYWPAVSCYWSVYALAGKSIYQGSPRYPKLLSWYLFIVMR